MRTRDQLSDMQERLLVALDMAMQFASAHCNRLRALERLAQELSLDQFSRLAEQAPETITRDLAWATDDFQKAKTKYEGSCREFDVAAYGVWSED